MIMTLDQLITGAGTFLCAWLLGLLGSMASPRRPIGLDLGTGQALRGAGPGEQAAPSPRPRGLRHALDPR
jgi:hypothetical protein